MPDTKLDLADIVHMLRAAMLTVDPGAYRGFVIDTAIRAVAEKNDMKWRVVLKAYREKYPLNRISLGPLIPYRAKRLSPAVLAVRDAYLKE